MPTAAVRKPRAGPSVHVVRVVKSVAESDGSAVEVGEPGGWTGTGVRTLPVVHRIGECAILHAYRRRLQVCMTWGQRAPCFARRVASSEVNTPPVPIWAQ